jgi:hypothetical protein
VIFCIFLGKSADFHFVDQLSPRSFSGRPENFFEKGIAGSSESGYTEQHRETAATAMKH